MTYIKKYKKCICILRKYCKKSKNVQANVQALQPCDVNVQNAESVAVVSESVAVVPLVPSCSEPVDEQLFQEVESFNVRILNFFFLKRYLISCLWNSARSKIITFKYRARGALVNGRSM